MTTTAKIIVNDVDDSHGGTVCTREIAISSLGGGGPVAWNDITGKPATFAPSTHSHDASYAVIGHNHDADYESAGAASVALATALAADFSGDYNDLTNKPVLFSGAYADLTGKPTLGDSSSKDVGTAAGTVAAGDHTHAGGSDPWTYAVLATDKTASAAAAINIGLGFTPAANTKYEFVARLMVRTATATVGPRPGVAWASGLTDGVVFIQQTSSATANVFANGNINAAVLAPVGGLPNATQSFPALIEGMAVAGANPSGSINIQLASETAGTNVIAKAGSFLKYRSYQ